MSTESMQEKAFQEFWTSNTANCQKSSYKYCRASFTHGWNACDATMKNAPKDPSFSEFEDQRAETLIREKFEETLYYRADELFLAGALEKLSSDCMYRNLTKIKENGELHVFPELTEDGKKIFVWGKTSRFCNLPKKKPQA